MFGWFERRKERKAYEMGRDVGATITGELEEYIKLRVLPAGERFVAVFEGQLKTIHNNPEHDPRLVTKVEWDIFLENLDKFAGEMKAELSVMTYKWDEVLDAIGGRESIDEFITERINIVVEDMREKAAGMALAVIEGLNDAEAAAKA